MRYWKRTNPDGTIRTVESYSHDLDIEGAIEIDEAEFKAFLASLPPPPPPIDWKAKWAAASTATDKLKVLAQRLGLE
jgi:hypothetical protein